MSESSSSLSDSPHDSSNWEGHQKSKKSKKWTEYV